MRKEGSVITVGTSCRRNGCHATFIDNPTSYKPKSCSYHPGAPLFHEVRKKKKQKKKKHRKKS